MGASGSGGKRGGSSGRGNGQRGGSGGRVQKYRPRCQVCNRLGHIAQNCAVIVGIRAYNSGYRGRGRGRGRGPRHQHQYQHQQQQQHQQQHQQEQLQQEQQQEQQQIIAAEPVANQETAIVGTEAPQTAVNGENALVNMLMQQMQQMEERMAERMDRQLGGFRETGTTASINAQMGNMAIQSTMIWADEVERAIAGQEEQLPEQTTGDEDFVVQVDFSDEEK